MYCPTQEKSWDMKSEFKKCFSSKTVKILIKKFSPLVGIAPYISSFVRQPLHHCGWDIGKQFNFNLHEKQYEN